MKAFRSNLLVILAAGCSALPGVAFAQQVPASDPASEADATARGIAFEHARPDNLPACIRCVEVWQSLTSQ